MSLLNTVEDALEEAIWRRKAYSFASQKILLNWGFKPQCLLPKFRAKKLNGTVKILLSHRNEVHNGIASYTAPPLLAGSVPQGDPAVLAGTLPFRYLGFGVAE